MAQKRMKRQSTLSYGKSGEAFLVKLDESKARFDFADGESVTLKVVLGNVFEDEKATLPEYVPFKKMSVNKKLKVRATFDEDEKKILFINPLSGEQQVKFVKFQAPEGSAPVWTEKQGKGGKTYREANPFFQIVEGNWKGCTVRGRLFDNFGADPEDGNTSIYFGSRGTSSQNLEDFCACVGYDYWEHEYNENLLPEIEKTALKNDNTFSLVLVNGWISSFNASFEEDAFGDEEEETGKEEEELNPLLED